MNANDVVYIVLDAYIRWARQLDLEQIDQWVQPFPQKYKADYERFVLSRHRRFIMITVLSDSLADAGVNYSRERSALTGWREVGRQEAENLVQRILSWLAGFAIGEAFAAVLELIVQWAEQYNTQMAVEDALFCGRNDANQYTDENITAFLRWCFGDELILADSQTAWQLWAD